MQILGGTAKIGPEMLARCNTGNSVRISWRNKLAQGRSKIRRRLGPKSAQGSIKGACRKSRWRIMIID
jgi:hypothetical protein